MATLARVLLRKVDFGHTYRLIAEPVKGCFLPLIANLVGVSGARLALLPVKILTLRIPGRFYGEKKSKSRGCHFLATNVCLFSIWNSILFGFAPSWILLVILHQ